MEHSAFTKYVDDIKVGKKLPDSIYVHTSAFDELPQKLTNLVKNIGAALKISEENWNIVKFSRRKFTISLLHYPQFFEDSYPSLQKSVFVNLEKLSHKVTDYSNYDNPPILHRKETMISQKHASYDSFCILTQEGEAAGLYENTRHIGFKASWESVICGHGYELVDGRLFRKSSVNSIDSEKVIFRDKTAIVRYQLSAPMKALANSGFLEGQFTIFDYGCGRGDDMRELQSHGIDASGWDPNFMPDTDVVSSQLVNLGFVINVIEDRNERIEALQNAWNITEKVLVVSAMLAQEDYLTQFTPYKDGVITTRNTFQKYFNQSELKLFIELSLDDQAIAVGPGIYFVFKDKELEKEFLQNKHRRKQSWLHKSERPASSKAANDLVITRHLEVFDAFYNNCLLLGRCPAINELADAEMILELTGSLKKAFRMCVGYYGTEDLNTARKMRREDLLVYYAVSLFGNRKPLSQLSDEAKNDIKEFFGTNKQAQLESKELLFNISDVDKIEAECIEMNSILPASVLDTEFGAPHSLSFHKQYMDLLSPLLRVYVSAALQLYGELDDIQLVKIHISSGKLTLLGYIDFDTADMPVLRERIKIKMAEQDVDFFDYTSLCDNNVLQNKQSFLAS
ncbi:MAG: DNA phosphorothioation-associated putative methyltransferase [Pseudoalteromonas sp.]